MIISNSISQILVLSSVLYAAPKNEETPDSTPRKQDEAELPNVDGQTLGGTQFWTDELIYDNWRIQRNVVFGQRRLLDDKNVRRAWGSFEACSRKLDQFKVEEKLSPPTGKVVVVVHGLGRTRNSMNKLCNFLEKEGGFKTVNVTYASTRESIHKHAESLERVVAGLDQAKEVNFVAHSMGNIVIRRMLANMTAANEIRVPRVKVNRIVMLGPPNNGAELAKRLEGSGLFEIIIGPSGKQLASQWAKLEKQLAIPRCEFGIIAGGSGNEIGRNPLVKGDDDLVVSVAESKLLGASDFRVVPVAHTFLMDDPRVREFTLRFLRHGYFASAKERQPIEKD